MRTWYKINQTADDVVGGKKDEPYRSFTRLQMSGTLPPGAAIYGTDDAGSDPFSLYFSPVAASISLLLIVELGGVPCSAPKRSEVIQMVGAAFDSDFAKE
jgi:hypothetical protein